MPRITDSRFRNKFISVGCRSPSVDPYIQRKQGVCLGDEGRDVGRSEPDVWSSGKTDTTVRTINKW